MGDFGTRLAWTDLPEDIHDAVTEALGSPVVQADSQASGFSPGSADRVRTRSGRSAFVKAVSNDQNPDTPGLHRREIEILRTLHRDGLDLAPALIAAHDDGTWVALVTEDVDGRSPRQPWVPDELAATLKALAEIARHEAPSSWPDLAQELQAEFGRWEQLRDDPPAGLDPWAAAHLDELHELSLRTLPRLAGDAIAHTDVRADNLLVEDDGTVRVVDWPWASRGAPWFDASGLLIDVWAVGEVDLGSPLAAIEALGATRDDVRGVVAGLGGFLWTRRAGLRRRACPRCGRSSSPAGRRRSGSCSASTGADRAGLAGRHGLDPAPPGAAGGRAPYRILMHSPV